MFKKDKNTLLSDNNIISQTYHPFLSIIEIDTIRMSKKRYEVTDNQLEYLLHKFNAYKVNSFLWRGKYKGFELDINDFTITIIGSPSNYYVGKANTLPYKQFRNAIEKLSKDLEIDLHCASLYRVDVNWNYITKKLIESYTHNLFLDLSRFKRLERGLGVIFKTNSIAIDIYNKTQYLKDKKIINDIENWLRIEFRVLKDVNKILGIQYVSDLYYPKNYKKLLSKFIKYYQNIRKQTLLNDDISTLKSPKEYKKLLELAGITQKGGFSSVYRDIEHMSKMKVFDNPNQKYRLRKELQNLAENPLISKPHPLIIELNTQFDIDLDNEIKRLGILY